jgi:hypothetical protein
VLSIAVDSAGNAYATGSSSSADFPTTPGAFDTTHNGDFDAFVTKLNGTGSLLVYSTFLGGLNSDSGSGLAVDPAGDAYVAGGTNSADFPTTPGAFDTVLNDSEAFVTKLNATGSALVYSTFLGGSGFDGASSLALGAGGNAHITGSTGSLDFPVTAGAFDRDFNGGVVDAFVAVLNADASALVYSTFLGGSGSAEGGSDLALDPAGGIYVTGQTMSPNFPTTPGAFDRVWNGDDLIFWADAFVAKFTIGGVPPPPPPPSAALSSVSFNPASVVGGNASQGTITLTSGAGSGGAVVTLSSSNGGVASVPPSVSVAAGAATATFTVSTTSVTTSTPVTISAAYNGLTRTATLTVTPASTGTPGTPALVAPPHDARFRPGQTINFDWSNVTGAVSYTIQIDDSTSFSAPLVLTQTLTASQFSTSSLPVRRMWWRVRANSASGTSGNWSNVRRFEIKD